MKKVYSLLTSEVTVHDDEEPGGYVLGYSRFHPKSPDRIDGDFTQLYHREEADPWKKAGILTLSSFSNTFFRYPSLIHPLSL